MLRRSSIGGVVLILLLVGCGSSSKTGTSSSSSGPGALSADAKSAATGDIPDNQSFLTYRDRKVGYSMRYPEGWTVRRAGGAVTFQDKNNLVRIAIAGGGTPTVASVEQGLAGLRAASPTFTAGTPVPVALKSGRAIKVSYTTRSAPNPVTGRAVELQVDRYVLARRADVATVDLGTPRGVDNVDAYRMMIGSFRWT